jgi:hypothetical protein
MKEVRFVRRMPGKPEGEATVGPAKPPFDI